MTGRVAIFVDGENISHSHAEVIRSIGDGHGRTDVVRVYGNAIQLPGWQSAHGFKFVHSGVGKNATDLLLAIEAIELACSASCGTIIIASSDGDFTHLALRLRERGTTVVGLGEKKTNSRFRQACSVFHELDVSVDVAEGEATEGGETATTPLDRKIRQAIAKNSENGNGMHLAKLGQLMYQKHDIKISGLSDRNWRTYFEARKGLYEIVSQGPNTMVRFRSDGFALAELR